MINGIFKRKRASRIAQDKQSETPAGDRSGVSTVSESAIVLGLLVVLAVSIVSDRVHRDLEITERYEEVIVGQYDTPRGRWFEGLGRYYDEWRDGSRDFAGIRQADFPQGGYIFDVSDRGDVVLSNDGLMFEACVLFIRDGRFVGSDRLDVCECAGGEFDTVTIPAEADAFMVSKLQDAGYWWLGERVRW